MQNFQHCVPTNIVFGRNQVAESLPTLIPRTVRVFLLYGQGSLSWMRAVYDQVKSLVNVVSEFGEIEANPDHDSCMEAVRLIKEHKAEYILAIGGGSVVDAAKYITCAVGWTKTEDPYDILLEYSMKGNAALEPNAALPIGTVMTLPATGSESNCTAVISLRRKHLKYPFKHPSCYPKFSIIDPALTFSLPKRQVVNGVTDCIIHVLEQYLPHYDMCAVTDEFCEGIIRIMLRSGPITIADPTNYKARADLCWCASLGLNNLLGRGAVECWGTHYIGHELTAFYGIDHGMSLSSIIPEVMRFHKATRGKKYAQMAERVFGVAPGSVPDMAEEGIKRLEEFFNSIGAHTRLSKFGYDDRHFEAIAAKFGSMKICPPENLVGTPEVLEILKKSL